MNAGITAARRGRRVRAPRGSRRKTTPGKPELTAQQAIGNFLRATRKAQKLTQAEVASMTHGSPWELSRAAVSAIERGQNFPGMEAMLALSNVLYVDPKELVERARLSAVVPLDVTGLSYDELEARASRYFWSGAFRKALAVYDAMLERVVLELEDEDEISARRATLEIRRATALKRTGALLAALASAERAITLSVKSPRIQAEAYIVLADLQCARGHLPLASDAAQRALDLSQSAGPRVQGWAWMVKARVLYLSRSYEDAKRAFLEALQQARLGADKKHVTHIEGDIGMCWAAQGESREARKWIVRAVESARRQVEPALEASWLIELGRLALSEQHPDEADQYAQAALRIAKPREHQLSIFRAEWLRHLVVRRRDPLRADDRRLARLRKLFLQLDQHEGIGEIREFKQTVLRDPAVEHRNES